MACESQLPIANAKIEEDTLKYTFSIDPFSVCFDFVVVVVVVVFLCSCLGRRLR